MNYIFALNIGFMKKLTALLIFTFLLFSDFLAFAQDPGNGGGIGDNGDGGDGAPPTPIDSKLILLAIVGIAFVLYTFRKNKKIV